ncbi:MAG TPA: universal stress protein [Jatrophihabitans sp.]
MTASLRRAIVVGIDGSPSAWAALWWADDEAIHTHRRLVVIYAGDTRALPESADERPYGRALLCEAVASLGNSHPHLTVQTRLSTGDPAEELVDASASADLVVVGVADTTGGHAALRFAFAEATLRGAEVVAVRSWSPFEWQLASPGPAAASGTREPAEDGLLSAALRPFGVEFPQVPLWTVLSSEPVEVALPTDAGCERLDESALAWSADA